MFPLPLPITFPGTTPVVPEPPLLVEDIPYRWVREELRFPGLLKKGARSRAVRRVQECLTLEGIGLRIDGIFGNGTAAAVERFQAQHALPATGEVDATTHNTLIRPFLNALEPIEPRDHTLGELMVAYARQHLAEHPREVGGQNRGPWVRMYMRGNESLWCAAFVCFVMNQAADTLQIPAPVETTFSCDVLAARGRAAGLFLGETELEDDPMRRHDLTAGSIFLHRRVANDWTHTGIVAAAPPLLPFADSDHYDTIEGNTNDDGHREGYEVCERIRGFADKDFIAIA
jgi:hypothetical protein